VNRKLACTFAILIGSLVTIPALAKQGPWPDLSAPPPLQGGGESDAALLIGIEDYLLVEDVPGALDNIDDWYMWLKKTRGLPLGSTVMLRDEQATRETILEETQEAAGRVGPGGTLWFLFIGHGAPSKDGQDGLLLGADVQQTASSVYARGVSQAELLEILARGSGANTVLVLDTCFSGKSGGGAALVDGLQPLIPGYAVQKPGATILTAGRGNEFAGPLPGVPRPAFSYLVLGGLYGWADLDGNGDVTAGEAVRYAGGVLTELVRDRRQNPELVGSDEDLVLSHGQLSRPDLTTIALSRTREEHPAASGASTALPAERAPAPEPPMDQGATEATDVPAEPVVITPLPPTVDLPRCGLADVNAFQERVEQLSGVVAAIREMDRSPALDDQVREVLWDAESLQSEMEARMFRFESGASLDVVTCAPNLAEGKQELKILVHHLKGWLR